MNNEEGENNKRDEGDEESKETGEKLLLIKTRVI